MDEKALSAIQLCLSREVLREFINEKTAAGIWSKLESLYMTKSLANKLRLKEQLFTDGKMPSSLEVCWWNLRKLNRGLRTRLS